MAGLAKKKFYLSELEKTKGVNFGFEMEEIHIIRQ